MVSFGMLGNLEFHDSGRLSLLLIKMCVILSDVCGSDWIYVIRGRMNPGGMLVVSEWFVRFAYFGKGRW